MTAHIIILDVFKGPILIQNFLFRKFNDVRIIEFWNNFSLEIRRRRLRRFQRVFLGIVL